MTATDNEGKPKKLLEQLRDVMRLKHYSLLATLSV